MAPRMVSGRRPYQAASPCRFWLKTGGCRFGPSCKFSHDQSAQDNIHRNGPPSGSRPSSSSQPSDPEREKLETWRRLRPTPNLAGDRQTASYFRMAADLVEEDVSLAQQVVRDMASESRLLLLKDVLEGLSQKKTPTGMAMIWESRIFPLFRIIVHPDTVDSIVVEQETATIYRALLGIDATRLKRLYDFVFGIVDHWSESPLDTTDTTCTEVLSLGCGVLVTEIYVYQQCLNA
ncbi:nf-x1 finger and helicase domain [Colletotrichum sojae]|uniref:Nf-x1 finger and helicase domain n=1 Tax=Colletotrichum sojae TaxID=2175907 RepID=A0A8H6IMC2_9PEZI|nr:nf-x1 finger and helicase domain [Colletotrichum sojae]